MNKIQKCHISSQSLYNRSNSPLLSPLLSRSSPRSLLTSPQPSPSVRHLYGEQILSSLRMTLQSVLRQKERHIFLRFLGHVLVLLRLFCLLCSALTDWHALMSPKVKLKRLKVWHLNTVPAGSMHTYTWPTHKHKHTYTHTRADRNDLDMQSVIMCKHLCVSLFLWP